MINRAANKLQDRAPRHFREVTRELSALKTRQLLGSDNLVMGQSNVAFISFTLAAGQQVSATFTNTPLTSTNRPRQAELQYSIFVDNDNNVDYLLPVGASITSTVAKNVDVRDRRDFVTSDNNTGKVSHIVQIFNNTPDTHTFYLYGQFISPETPTA